MTRVSMIAGLLLLSAPVVAQESPAPPPYFLLTESTVDPADSGDWAEAVAVTAKAHAEHPEGNIWAAYRLLTGGPHETVRIFFPLNSMGDLDGWVSNRQILQQTLGQDRARIVDQDLDLAERSAERILAFSAKMSRPWPNFRAPRYAWVEEVTVADDKMVEYGALVERIVRAFDQHQSDGYWIVYGNALGGDSSTVIWMYGFQEFAEIDAWESRLEALSKSMEKGEAARLVAALEAISETTTSLWQLEPALSQLTGE